jgi:hypothetical protein
MLLYHQTTQEYLLEIINSGKLLPASETDNMNQSPYDGLLPYVFLMPYQINLNISKKCLFMEYFSMHLFY